MSMDSILLTVLGAVLTVLGTISAVFLSNISKDMKGLRAELSEFKVHVASTYITKKDLQEHCALRHD